MVRKVASTARARVGVREQLEPGDKVQVWNWSGGERYDPIPLRVVRVNKKTITCRTQQGAYRRVPAHRVSRRDWDTEDEF